MPIEIDWWNRGLFVWYGGNKMKKISEMSFSDRIYEQLKHVPVGRVTTYHDLAQSIGTRAYRAVGRAMRDNPYAPKVPCHRVVRNDGSLGGFMGHTEGSEIEKKKQMLIEEGIGISGNKVVDLEKVRFEW